MKLGFCFFEGVGEEVSESEDIQVVDWGITYLVKKQNGYVYVEGEKFGDIFDNVSVKGWVPERYIRAACPKCNGWCSDPKKNEYFAPAWFYYGEDYVKCPQCHGRGY